MPNKVFMFELLDQFYSEYQTDPLTNPPTHSHRLTHRLTNWLAKPPTHPLTHRPTDAATHTDWLINWATNQPTNPHQLTNAHWQTPTDTSTNTHTDRPKQRLKPSMKYLSSEWGFTEWELWMDPIKRLQHQVSSIAPSITPHTNRDQSDRCWRASSPKQMLVLPWWKEGNVTIFHLLDEQNNEEQVQHNVSVLCDKADLMRVCHHHSCSLLSVCDTFHLLLHSAPAFRENTSQDTRPQAVV